MTEPRREYIPDETDHEQAFVLFDAVSSELSNMSDEQVLGLFRAANLAIARTMIYQEPHAVRLLSEYQDRADSFSNELHHRHHRHGRK